MPAPKSTPKSTPDEYVTVDFTSLRIREIEALEELLGGPVDQANRSKYLRAVACVIKRREDPDFSLEDAGDLIVKYSEPPNPTSAAG